MEGEKIDLSKMRVTFAEPKLIENQLLKKEHRQIHIRNIKSKGGKMADEVLNVNVDLGAVNEKIDELKKKVDETKGIVSEKEDEEKDVDESYVIEKADSGRGFAISRDYTKGSTEVKGRKLLRLTRDD